MATVALRTARLEARCTPELSETIEKAAAISGRSKTDYMLAAIQDAAVKTIQTYQTMKLNEQDSIMFAEAFLNPSEPSAELQKAVKRYNSASS